MCDIKSVISLLCKHLTVSIDVSFKPEYFRLAKYDAIDENLNRVFWTALHVLSTHAVREHGGNVGFNHLDTLSQVKLHFAYLSYPRLEFYGLAENSSGNRELLVAFAWLLTTHKVLDIAVRLKLASSVLGKECSYFEMAPDEFPSSNPSWSIATQINNILNLNGKMNHGLREIQELVTEKAKLLAKVHAASLNVSGLPHLNVSEMALIKRFATNPKALYDRGDQKKLHELRTSGMMLDTHMKWIRREHFFFEWMVSVIKERNNKPCASSDTGSWHEVSKFVSLLRCVVREKLLSNETTAAEVECWSRFVRTQSGNENVDNWLAQATNVLSGKKEEIKTKKEELSAVLEIMLKSIPHCVHV